MYIYIIKGIIYAGAVQFGDIKAGRILCKFIFYSVRSEMWMDCYIAFSTAQNCQCITLAFSKALRKHNLAWNNLLRATLTVNVVFSWLLDCTRWMLCDKLCQRAGYFGLDDDLSCRDRVSTSLVFLSLSSKKKPSDTFSDKFWHLPSRHASIFTKI